MGAADAGQAVMGPADRSDEDSSLGPYGLVDGVVRHAEASGTAARRIRRSPFRPRSGRSQSWWAPYSGGGCLPPL